MNLSFQECTNTSPNSAATEVSLNHGIIFSRTSLWCYLENSATSLIALGKISGLRIVVNRRGISFLVEISIFQNETSEKI